MNIAECSSAGINYKTGLVRFMNKRDMYEKYLLAFLKDESYEKLNEAMIAGDIHGAFSAGHSMKGVAGNLSMDTLYDALVPFVDALRGEGNMEQAERLFPAVQMAYGKVTSFLNKEK